MTAPLVLAPPLIEGESLNGYVSRSAQLFGRTPRDFCTDLGMRWPYLCSGHDDQMERLAWLIGESPEKLSAHTAGKVGEGRFKLGQTVVTLGTMRRTAVRLCPQCVVTALTEIGPHGVFQLLEWAVTSLHTCGRHKCYLMTLPPANHAHTNYDFVARVLDNIDAVQSACMSPETAQQTAFERYIRERIQRGPKNDWLKDLDLTQIHRLCLNLGAAIEGFKMKIMKTLGSQQERSLCQLGFKNVRAGPDGFKAALKRLHRQSTSDRPYFSADMGPFYQWLREYYEDPTLAPLVDLTCDHIFETYPVPTGKEVFDRVAPKQTLLNMHEARKRSGFGVMFLKGLLGHLDGVDLAEANLRTDVRVDELARAQAYVEGLINLEDAARMLGLSRPQIKALQSCGVLDMIKITSSLRYVLRNQAEKLLDKLKGLPTALPDRSVVPLREFCRSKQVTMVQIIDLWVQGELDGKLCRGEGVGLQAIEVEWSLLSEKVLVKLIGDLSADEAARYLKVSVAFIRRLRDEGYLEAVSRRNPDTNHVKQFITKRSISEFEQQYVTLGQLAENLKMMPFHLARKLDRDDVSPINCRIVQLRVYSKDALRRWYGEDA